MKVICWEVIGAVQLFFRAIDELLSDIDSVKGNKPEIVAPGGATDYEIIIGMVGKSKTI
jgi:hypothetical protein